ncbi:MAG: quinone-dependent dihydroorotate dehydrogenase [Chloroflexota bacterium]
MYRWIRPLLFRLEPEQAHHLTLNLVRLAGSLPPLAAALRQVYRTPSLPVQAFGLTFDNPVGLAAGYDKDGLGWRGLACLGFGHIEVGTITLRPQPGNPRPRVFRLPPDQALINRMGFPGEGAAAVAPRLARRRPGGVIIGANLGKNKDTPLEAAGQDYQPLVEIFAPLADYLAINVSSPNTVGLRRLQARQALEDLLGPLARLRDEQQQRLGRRVPLLVKLAPDLEPGELEDALQAIEGAGMDGVIATNTTLARDGLTSPRRVESGGLSGAPLRERSAEVLRRLVEQTRLPVIAAGGIMDPDDAAQRLHDGAALLQVYTGLVYAGPGLVQHIGCSLKAAGWASPVAAAG